MIGDDPFIIEREMNLSQFSSLTILGDNNTKIYCLPRLYKMFPKLRDSVFIEIPSGESNKNLETCSLIWDSLYNHKIDRKGLLINLGGGVITDMGAFAASTFKRGISFFQIPTTLLSMVDASIGGKTGIDFQGAKNILGTFMNPVGVWIDTGFLETLPFSEIYSGFSEIVKHGLIADPELFDKIAKDAAKLYRSLDSIQNLVARSVSIKNTIVLEDPFEKGLRKLLNFGHTLGHALESHSFNTDHPLNHGQAIAIGMVGESYLSSIAGLLSEAELKRIVQVLKPLHPNRPILESEFSTLYSLMLNDKKNTSGSINFTFLDRIGKGKIDQGADQMAIFNSFKFFNSILDI